MTHVFGYSLETIRLLIDKAENLNVMELLREVGTLRAKVSFYESRLDDMEKFRHAHRG